MDTDLHADYDDGCFDKDEQGWCARRVQVTTDGTRVTIRRSGDDNGARPYDRHQRRHASAPPGPRSAWSRSSASAAPSPTSTATPVACAPPASRSRTASCRRPPIAIPAASNVIMHLLAPVAAALGMRPGSPPAAPTMPPLVPSLTAGDALREPRHLPRRARLHLGLHAARLSRGTLARPPARRAHRGRRRPRLALRPGAHAGSTSCSSVRSSCITSPPPPAIEALARWC
jgi:hypothetical protein